MIPFIALIFIGGVAAGIWQFVRPGLSGVERLIRGLVSLSIALAAIVVLMRLAQSLSQDWNEAKLAPVVAMTRGYALYQDPSAGVMTGWIYGPIGAIVLLPAALASGPTTTVLIGVAVAMTVYLAPAGWALAMASRGRVPQLAILAFLCLVFESLIAEDLSRCMTIAAPDATAIGLATCACAAIYPSRSLRNMLLSALAAVLCIWTKQNYAPIVLASVLWIALSDGWKAACAYVAMLIGVGIAISAVLLACFSPSAMWFHMVMLPSSHPWRDQEHNVVAVWLLGLHDLIFTCAMNLGLLGAVVIMDLVLRPGTGVRRWFGTHPWMLFVLTAIFLIPGGLTGYLKVGGHVNSLACTNFFLMLASLMGAVELGAEIDVRTPLRRFFEVALLCLGLVFGVHGMFGSTNGLLWTWPIVARPYRNAHEIAFAYAKAHPGEIYCPWSPLTTLLADGKLYHFEWGIIDRLESKWRPSNEQLRSHFPQRLNKVVYLSPPQSTTALQVLVQFKREIRVPELDDCVVYTR